MALLDALTGQVDELDMVEVVTMHADLSDGLTINDVRTFPDLQSALAYVGNLSVDERERSWIRRGGDVQTLAAAELELAALAPALSPMDGR